MLHWLSGSHKIISTPKYALNMNMHHLQTKQLTYCRELELYSPWNEKNNKLPVKTASGGPGTLTWYVQTDDNISFTRLPPAVFPPTSPLLLQDCQVFFSLSKPHFIARHRTVSTALALCLYTDTLYTCTPQEAIRGRSGRKTNPEGDWATDDSLST
jgi:hypothetical protein